MRLYMDEKLAAETADAEALERALARFAKTRTGSLELRRSSEEYLRASRGPAGECCLELRQPRALMGFTLEAGELGQARAAFQDFLRGLAPRFLHEDDCPLCRLAERLQKS